MKKPLITVKPILWVLFLLMTFFSVQAFAAVDSPGVLNNVIDRFERVASNWQRVMHDRAEWLFWLLVTISMVWTFGMMALRKADIGEFFAEFIRFIMFTGFYWWLLENGPRFAIDIMRSLRNIGAEASSLPNDLTPSGIVDMGFGIFFKVIDQSSIWEPIDTLFGMLLGAVIMIIFALIGVNMLLLLISGYLFAYAGVFILGFGGSKWTSDMAIGYYKSILNIGLQLMAMILIIGVGKTFLNDYYTAMSAGLTLKEMGVMVVVASVMLFLVAKIPPQIGALAGGTTGSLGSNFGAGAAVAAATMGAAAIASAGAALAAGAASGAGGAQALMAAFSKASAAEASGGGAGSSALMAAAGGAGGDSSGGGSGGGSALGAAMGDSMAGANGGSGGSASSSAGSGGADGVSGGSGSTSAGSGDADGGSSVSGSASADSGGADAGSGGSGSASAGAGSADGGSGGSGSASTSAGSTGGGSGGSSSASASSGGADGGSGSASASSGGADGDAGGSDSSKSSSSNGSGAGDKSSVGGGKGSKLAAAAGAMAAKAGRIAAGTAVNLAQGSYDVAKERVLEMKDSVKDRIADTTGGRIAAAIQARQAATSVDGESATFEENSLSGDSKSAEAAEEIAAFRDRKS
jgi:type IV secretion system protein TrbL